MPRCKHYFGVTSEQIEDLGKFVSVRLSCTTDHAAALTGAEENLKLAVVYDPLKKVLKVSLTQNPRQLPENRIWNIIDYLMIGSQKLYPADAI
jgi:hypothetical protein